MKVEQPEKITEDKDVISLSSDEFKKFASMDTDDPRLIELMEAKGIAFDSGDVAIEIDGIKERMVTEKNDFGTLLSLEKIEEIYGEDEMKTIEARRASESLTTSVPRRKNEDN